MKNIYFLLNYLLSVSKQQFRHLFGTFLNVFQKVFRLFGYVIFYHKLIIYEKYGNINIFYYKFK